MSEELPPVPGGLAIGSLLAGYRCEEEIGRGGMAVVYRAHDDRLDRRVALKVLAPDLARDEMFRARFIQESRIAAATEHPHIIPVFNAGEVDGVLYIAMRYVPDGDVRSLIDRLGPLPVARAIALIGQAASALDAAHARGLVHRDVKPTNMLLELSPRTSRPDHLYLSDFGLAKPSTAASGLTMTGQFFGTVDYVAPEQIQSQPLDGRTDQYALACTSFEMLCGSPPFKRENGMAVISAQLSEPPPRLSDRRPDLPAAVDRVIARALAKSPADRYERCLDFAEALAAASRPGPGTAVPGGAAHPPTRMAAPVSPDTRADPGGPPGAGTPGAGRGAPAAGAVLPAAGAAAAAAGSGTPTVLPRGPGYPNASPPTDPRFTDPRLAGRQPPPYAAGPGAGRPGAGRPGAGGQAGPAGAAWWGGRPPEPPPPPSRGGPPRRRSRGAVAAGVAGLLVVLFLGAAGVTYLVTHRHTGGTPAPVLTTVTARASPTTSNGASPAGTASVPPVSPAGTVQAYYAAINGHHYARAWRLGGRNSGSSYPNFVSGFAGTRNDTVTILSVSGDVVTARIAALQTDGTLKTYQGTYTVANGVISQFNVHQIS
ncbi:MAG TPA: serine/threonine-protein kinase [Streptosporangiaceae bacterium]|nr:serine/threonine-protein kinase [Streptosporangiaceae bacterium]